MESWNYLIYKAIRILRLLASGEINVRSITEFFFIAMWDILDYLEMDQHVFTFTMGWIYQHFFTFAIGLPAQYPPCQLSQVGARTWNCEVAANPSWFWVHSSLQVKWNIRICINPRTKCSLFERGLCWIESVPLAPPVAAAPSLLSSSATQSPWPHRKQFEILLQKVSWIELLCVQWLQYQAAACNHRTQLCTSRAQKNKWKLLYWRSFT